MTRREFFHLLSRSGLVLAGGSFLSSTRIWAQSDLAAAAPAGDLGCAVNPFQPYLDTHPFPWPAAVTPGSQNFDLLTWECHEGRNVPAQNPPLGKLSLTVETQGNTTTYTVHRATPSDDLTTEFHCANDPWATPQAWTVAQHPVGPDVGMDLSSTIQGSFQNGTAVLGRDADRKLDLPLTSLAALAGSTAVLEHAANSGTSFYALSESGLLVGPLQARIQGSLTAPGATDPIRAVALWGPRLVPSHILYDSSGTLAQTGFLVSAVRPAS